MKKIIVIGILGMILVSFVSAGLLGYFGKIEGSVTVEDPVFYLSTSNKLLINNYGSPAELSSLNDNELKDWTTDENLGGLDFYDMDVNFYLRANVSSLDEILTLTFGYLDSEETKYEICSSNVTISGSSLVNYDSISSCSGISISDVDEFYWEFKGNCDSCEYGISEGADNFYSRVEVTAT